MGSLNCETASSTDIRELKAERPPLLDALVATVVSSGLGQAAYNWPIYNYGETIRQRVKPLPVKTIPLDIAMIS
jgi:hypothetical protein